MREVEEKREKRGMRKRGIMGKKGGRGQEVKGREQSRHRKGVGDRRGKAR